MTDARIFPGDVAISSASFVLVRSDLQSIATLIDLSRTVFRRVKLNFVSFLPPRIYDYVTD